MRPGKQVNVSASPLTFTCVSALYYNRNIYPLAKTRNQLKETHLKRSQRNETREMSNQTLEMGLNLL